MYIAAGIGITAIIALFLVRIARQSSRLSDALQQAQQSGDLQPVVRAVESAPEDDRPTQWDQAIGALWQAYARREAAQLVVEAAERSEATILQYWIQQVLQVEPDIASEVFTDEFLQRHFKPEVAARCGKSGCCG